MKQYKPLIYFLVKFFATYFILTLGYDYYLKHTQITDKQQGAQSDPYTVEVAKESSKLYNIFYGNAHVVQDKLNPYMNFFVGKQQISIINEGCNSISIMIIMIAFIVAFAVKVVPTFFYILIAILFVHVVNVFRISVLSREVFMRSPYLNLTHDVFFPGAIYGAVIVICVIWVKFFIFNK